MAHIPLFYGLRGEPLVTGFVFVRGIPLRPPLEFVIDTAADTSIIVPSSETLLRKFNPGRPLKFVPDGVKDAQTMLGHAPVKCMREPDSGIALPDVDSNPVRKSIENLYFANQRKPTIPRWIRKVFKLRRVWDSIGQGLTYNILGRDVLMRYALVSIPARKYGFLTDDIADLQRLLDGGQSLFASVATFYEKMLAPPDHPP